MEQGEAMITAEALWLQLKEGGETVGKTTVYRQLEQMAASGTARKAIAPDGAARYQYVEDASACQGHLHCQCVECGRLFHVDCAYLADLDEHLQREHGFGLNKAETVLMGRCAACQKGEKHNGPA